jgi:SAM-dependent methyltransferase
MTTSFDTKDYWEKRLAQAYDLGGVGLAGWGVDYNRWLYRVRARVFHRAVKRLNLEYANLRVLDIGSGTGFYIDQWRRLGVRTITGVDITKTAVGKLAERFPEHEFHELSIAEGIAPLETGSFDAISCMDVLFHIVDDDKYWQAMRNIESLLAPEGVFAFTEGFPPTTLRSARHVTHRSTEDIEAALANAGLERFYSGPSFVLMTDPIASRSRALHLFSRSVRNVILRWNRSGGVIGGALFPVELLLTSFVRPGPSLKIALARRETRQDKQEDR